MSPFVYEGHPVRVIFGSGTVARLPAEVERAGLRRVLVLSTEQQRAQGVAVAALLGGDAVGVFDKAAMHTPVEITVEAMALVVAEKIDGVVAIGGGSTIGLGKAIALRTDLPQIVIPTTYAGSEMTPILGETVDGSKATQSSPRIRPETVIYDVDLTLSLPAALSGTSGINAIAHGVEALYARERNPIVSLMALDGIGALVAALPVIVDSPADVDARSKALYGAWLCGACLGSVGMSLHHKLCHTLGGTFDLPHAETHTAVLPHALAYNAPAVPDAMAALRRVLGGDPARSLHALAVRVGAQVALKELGMPEYGIGIAADRALADPYWNPRELERDRIERLLRRAWTGAVPDAAV